MSRSEPAAFPAGDARSAANRQVCVGLLVALLVLPVAALGSSRGLGALALFGEIAALPAFMFLAGFLAGGETQWAVRAGKLLLVAATAALGGVGVALATRQDWREGLTLAAPVLRLLLLPLLYSVLMRPLRHAPAAYVMFLVLLCHVVGVVFGGRAGFVLTLAPYFAVGALVARRGDWFAGLLESESEYAAASGPVVLALAIVVCAGAAHAATLAAVGPASLLIGLAAGPAAVAGAGALAATPLAGPLARLGRAVPVLAIAWLPLFHFLVAIIDRGAGPRPVSLILLSAASLLIALVGADAFSGDGGAAADRRAEPATIAR